MKLLVVDDEIWSREFIKKVLNWRDIGFNQVIEAGDGKEALDILKHNTIDLMITDMKMPKMDGAEMLKQVRASHNMVEIIVISGYEDYAYLHEALKTKAIDYLLKPIVKEELEKAVLRALDIIREQKNYHYIEHILMHENSNTILNKYYETKTSVYKSLISKNPTKLAQQIEVIEQLIQSHETNAVLKDYVQTDLMHFVWKLETEYSHKPVIRNKGIVFEISMIRDSLMDIMQAIINREVYKKVSTLEVQKYIDSHYIEAISLADIADMFHVSKEHLSRIFKKDVGMSVQNYISNKKIEHAKTLLRRYRKLSIVSIGIMSGFVDNQYFYRVFKKQTGMTPMQYRANTSI